MNLIFYLVIFLIGTLFGSFYTLAVYRIPKRQDIIHTHSYCPNCYHKLGFFDLIPIASYLCLKGKCRYCKINIRPRYLILEILSGIVFVMIAYFTQFKIDTLSYTKIIEFSMIVLYITFIILIAGIDKEYRKIDKFVSVYGIVISNIYMIYLWIVGQASIYRYGIYLVFYIIVLLVDTMTLKKYAKNNYVTGILLMIITMTIFTGRWATATVIILTLLAICFYVLLQKIKQKGDKCDKSQKQIASKLWIGFYLGVCNIIVIILNLFVIYEMGI